jgi:hypothetical protein
MRNERGLSEVLGYILVFALVLTSIGFITVSGVSSLEDIRTAEQASNAERAFDVVHDNMAAIYERSSPSRATEIDLTNAQLFYTSNSSMEIQVGSEQFERQFRPVVLRPSDGTQIVYEAGAVILDQKNGGLVIEDPPLLFSTERVHAPIIMTTTPAIEGAGGTTVLLRGKSTAREALLADAEGNFAGDTITVTLSSPRYEIWERYFEEETALSGCSTDDSTETVECSMTAPDTVFVTLQQIEVSIIF